MLDDLTLNMLVCTFILGIDCLIFFNSFVHLLSLMSKLDLIVYSGGTNCQLTVKGVDAPLNLVAGFT